MVRNTIAGFIDHVPGTSRGVTPPKPLKIPFSRAKLRLYGRETDAAVVSGRVLTAMPERGDAIAFTFIRRGTSDVRPNPDTDLDANVGFKTRLARKKAEKAS